MSAQQQFLTETQQGIEQYRISSQSSIPSPNFLPEVKSDEDLKALLPHLDALEQNNPVIVPGYRFEEIRTKPAMSQYERQMRRLMNMPLIYYEPPEYFRYSFGSDLATYAFQGSRSKKSEFNDHIEAGRVDEAIEMLPKFFQPFMDRQRKSLLGDYDEGPSADSAKNGDVADGWGDPRSDRGYKDYYREIVENAKRASNSHVVPPVPPIRKSSSGTDIRRMRGSNRAMADICDATSFGFGNPVYSYYHIYADTSILRSGTDLDQELFTAIQSDLGAQNYGGVVLTFTGLEKAWENHVDRAAIDFVERLSGLAKRHQLPLLMPRSNWFGARLTDSGVNGFGALFNGKERYQSGGGMDPDNLHYQYGSVALYDEGVDPLIDQFDKVLQNNGGQVHPIPNLPDQPPSYNPRGSTYEAKYGSPYDFRIEFSKPRRLLHAQEAREFRQAIKRGTPNPATRYMERSQHTYLSR